MITDAVGTVESKSL